MIDFGPDLSVGLGYSQIVYVSSIAIAIVTVTVIDIGGNPLFTESYKFLHQLFLKRKSGHL